MGGILEEGGGAKGMFAPSQIIVCVGGAPPLSMPMEYLQRFERSREDKFLAKNFKGTQSDENIRGVLFIVFWAPTDDAQSSFIKIFLVVLKLQRRYDF